MAPNMASQPVGSPGQGVNPPVAGTQDTAGTTNPSADANANSEFIDIMRKVPRILCERYELLDVLGKGAHGRIYLAIDLVTHDRVAIKLVSFTFFIQTFYRWRNPAKTNLSFKGKSPWWRTWWNLPRESHLKRIVLSIKIQSRSSWMLS